MEECAYHIALIRVWECCATTVVSLCEPPCLYLPHRDGRSRQPSPPCWRWHFYRPRCDRGTRSEWPDCGHPCLNKTRGQRGQKNETTTQCAGTNGSEFQGSSLDLLTYGSSRWKIAERINYCTLQSGRINQRNLFLLSESLKKPQVSSNLIKKFKH